MLAKTFAGLDQLTGLTQVHCRTAWTIFVEMHPSTKRSDGTLKDKEYDGLNSVIWIEAVHRPCWNPWAKSRSIGWFSGATQLQVDHPYHQYCHLYCHHHQLETPHQGFMVVMRSPLHQISVSQLWSSPASPCRACPLNYSSMSQSKASQGDHESWIMEHDEWKLNRKMFVFWPFHDLVMASTFKEMSVHLILSTEKSASTGLHIPQSYISNISWIWHHKSLKISIPDVEQNTKETKTRSKKRIVWNQLPHNWLKWYW